MKVDMILIMCLVAVVVIVTIAVLFPQYKGEISTSMDANQYQIINMSVDGNGYTPNVLYAKANVPVKWMVDVKQLSGCNHELVLKEYGVDVQLAKGMNTVYFTPTKTGMVIFACGMNMMHGNFVIN
jgi:plastocyanin domain-containing protein